MDMIAYTERLGFDVLTAPIAEVDRRALSQAWFSALHLGKTHANPPVARISANGHAAKMRSDNATAQSKTYRRSLTSRHENVFHETRAANGVVGEPLTERRAPTSVLARRIERALLDGHVRYGKFVLDGMDGRVHVSIRSQGERVHIVAVCAPHAKAYVEQALQHARYALARKGIVFKSSLREMQGLFPPVGGDVR